MSDKEFIIILFVLASLALFILIGAIWIAIDNCIVIKKNKEVKLKTICDGKGRRKTSTTGQAGKTGEATEAGKT
jgi:hypothetical protein